MAASKRIQKSFRPDWEAQCDFCGQRPVVPTSGLCGPCHFGAADAINGGWWDEQSRDFDDQFVEDHPFDEA